MEPAARAREELLQRLGFFKLEPRVVVDLGCGSGAGAAALRKRYPRARVIAVDRDFPMTQQARRNQRFWRRFDCVCADGAALPLAAHSIDLMFNSLVLAYCENPDALLAEMRRALRPGGLLLLATLGPGTQPGPHAAGHFADMPQLGAALAHAGFIEPVLDLDRQAGVEYIYGAAFAGGADARAGAQAVARGDESVVPLGALRTRPRSPS
ncbi:MAG: methyltransferase domain-containing protein [Proteobacteria bacterium]|nr:methyltransferase domain-containing protein [Pseudomonadota bacterium]